jgi:hypothetical protein
MTGLEEQQVAQDRIRTLRVESYDALVATYLDKPTHDEVTVQSGARYDVQVHAL